MSSALAPIEAAVSTEIFALLGRQRRTQTQLAAHLGVSQGTLSKRLNGQLPWSLSALAATAEFFDVPITRLFPGDAATHRNTRDRRRHLSLISHPDRRTGRDRRNLPRPLELAAA